MTFEFLTLIGIGFLAQLVDGALGMAFSLISTTALLSLGMPPVQASAAVHTAEVATTGASGLSHLFHQNVDRRLFLTLGVPGPTRTRESGYAAPLGLVGGFLDAIGGGGWGPMVTSTLIGSGHAPRKVIGSVNAAEFFITVAVATTFFIELATAHVEHIAALIIGGLLAAPAAAPALKAATPPPHRRKA